MRRALLIAGILTLLVSAGCFWRSASDAGNENPSPAPNVSDISDAGLALAEGNRFLDTGETDEAIKALTKAVELDPNLAEAWFKLGIAYALAEKRDQGREITDDSNGNSGAASSKRSSKTNSEKAFEKAVAAYKKVVAANPEDDVAHFNLGRAYNKLNEDEDAAKALKQAVKIKPDDTEYQTELGAILIKLAQYHEAIPPLKKALELDPENIRALELLEDAQAGRSRVNYSSTPKEDKKKPGDNSNSGANSNTSAPTSNVQVPSGAPDPGPARPRPTPSRPTTKNS